MGMLSAQLTTMITPVGATRGVLECKNNIFGRVSAGTDPAPGSGILFVTARLVGAKNFPMIARPRLMESGMLKKVDARVLDPVGVSMFKEDETGDVPDRSLYNFRKQMQFIFLIPHRFLLSVLSCGCLPPHSKSNEQLCEE